MPLNTKDSEYVESPNTNFIGVMPSFEELSKVFEGDLVEVYWNKWATKKSIKDSYTKFATMFSSLPEPIKIYRGIGLYHDSNIETDSMETPEQFIKRIKKDIAHDLFGGVGIYWSWDKKFAQPYNGMRSSTIVTLEGQVNKSAVDWAWTLWLNIMDDFNTGSVEREVRLKEGAKVQLDKVWIGDREIPINKMVTAKKVESKGVFYHSSPTEMEESILEQGLYAGGVEFQAWGNSNPNYIYLTKTPQQAMAWGNNLGNMLKKGFEENYEEYSADENWSDKELAEWVKDNSWQENPEITIFEITIPDVSRLKEDKGQEEGDYTYEPAEDKEFELKIPPQYIKVYKRFKVTGMKKTSAYNDDLSMDTPEVPMTDEDIENIRSTDAVPTEDATDMTKIPHPEMFREVESKGVFFIGGDSVNTDTSGDESPFGIDYPNHFNGWAVGANVGQKLKKKADEGYYYVAVISYPSNSSMHVNPSFISAMERKLGEVADYVGVSLVQVKNEAEHFFKEQEKEKRIEEAKTRKNKTGQEALFSEEDSVSGSGEVKKDLTFYKKVIDLLKKREIEDIKERGGNVRTDAKIKIKDILLEVETEISHKNTDQYKGNIVGVARFAEVITGKDRVVKHEVYPEEIIFNNWKQLPEPIPVAELFSALESKVKPEDIQKTFWVMLQTYNLTVGKDHPIAQFLMDFADEGMEKTSGIKEEEYIDIIKLEWLQDIKHNSKGELLDVYISKDGKELLMDFGDWADADNQQHIKEEVQKEFPELLVRTENEIGYNEEKYYSIDDYENKFDMEVRGVKSGIEKTARRARQDDSLPVIKKLISMGYDKAQFHIHELLHKEVDICDAYNGKIFDLKKMVSNLQYNAPIFEATHVNCYCYLICYSTTNPDLDAVIVDWTGIEEGGRVVDRKDAGERKEDFERLFNSYRESLDNIENNSYIHGEFGDPIAGIYSFDLTMYDDTYYNVNELQEIRDKVLELVLDRADRYGINIEDAEIAGNHIIVQTSAMLRNYDFTKEDWVEVEWTYNKRREELINVIMDLSKLQDWLKVTQDSINNLLLEIEQKNANQQMDKFSKYVENSQVINLPIKNENGRVVGQVDGIIHYDRQRLYNWLEMEKVDSSVYGKLNKIKDEDLLPIAILKSMRVNDRQRGKGLGTEALEEFENEVLECKYVFLISDTGELNKFDLTQWYQRNGFTFLTSGDFPLMFKKLSRFKKTSKLNLNTVRQFFTQERDRGVVDDKILNELQVDLIMAFESIKKSLELQTSIYSEVNLNDDEDLARANAEWSKQTENLPFVLSSDGYFVEDAEDMLDKLEYAKTDKEKILAINEALNQLHGRGNVLGTEYNNLRESLGRLKAIQAHHLRFIVAGRVDFLREKFIKAVEDSWKDVFTVDDANGIFNQLVEADPTKNKQYLQWIIKQYLSKGHDRWRKVFIEDLPKIKSYLETYYKLSLQKKDLGTKEDVNNVFDKDGNIKRDENGEPIFTRKTRNLNNIDHVKDWRELQEVVKPHMFGKGVELSDMEKEIVKEEANLIYDGKVWQMWVPVTEKSACILGKGTEWCTAYGYEGGNYPDQTQNQFHYYDDMDDLIIFINKHVPQEKYQFHYAESQFMDAGDRDINVKDFLNMSGAELKKPLNEYLVDKRFQTNDLDERDDAISRLRNLATSDASKEYYFKVFDNLLTDPEIEDQVYHDYIVNHSNIEKAYKEWKQSKNPDYRLPWEGGKPLKKVKKAISKILREGIFKKKSKILDLGLVRQFFIQEKSRGVVDDTVLNSLQMDLLILFTQIRNVLKTHENIEHEYDVYADGWQEKRDKLILRDLPEADDYGSIAWEALRHMYHWTQAEEVVETLEKAKTDKQKILAINMALNEAHYSGFILGEDYNRLRSILGFKKKSMLEKLSRLDGFTIEAEKIFRTRDTKPNALENVKQLLQRLNSMRDFNVTRHFSQRVKERTKDSGNGVYEFLKTHTFTLEDVTEVSMSDDLRRLEKLLFEIKTPANVTGVEDVIYIALDSNLNLITFFNQSFTGQRITTPKRYAVV